MKQTLAIKEMLNCGRKGGISWHHNGVGILEMSNELCLGNIESLIFGQKLTVDQDAFFQTLRVVLFYRLQHVSDRPHCCVVREPKVSTIHQAWAHSSVAPTNLQMYFS